MGELFANKDDDLGYGIEYPRWIDSVRDRGMYKFGMKGWNALERQGAWYHCFLSGRSTVRVMCMHCQSMHEVTATNRKFLEEDDEKMMWFFMVR